VRCEDCERSADEWEGWIALRLEPGYGNDELVVLTYCPVCAAQFDEADPVVATRTRWLKPHRALSEFELP
jgi:hypothetical protein